MQDLVQKPHDKQNIGNSSNAKPALIFLHPLFTFSGETGTFVLETVAEMMP